MNKKCGCENCTCDDNSFPAYAEWWRNVEKHKSDTMDKVADLMDCIPKNAVIKIPVERIPPKIKYENINIEKNEVVILAPVKWDK